MASCDITGGLQIGPGKLDLLFHISYVHVLNLHAGRRPLFITSKRYIRLAKLERYAIKNWCVIVWKAIMIVEAAGDMKRVLMRTNKSSLPGLEQGLFQPHTQATSLSSHVAWV